MAHIIVEWQKSKGINYHQTFQEHATIASDLNKTNKRSLE